MWPLTQKRPLRRLRPSQRIWICVSEWLRQVAIPFSSVSTGPWWRVYTTSFTPNWLSGDVPVSNAPAWKVSIRSGVTHSAILLRLLLHVLILKRSCVWQCPCLSCSNGSTPLPAWIAAMRSYMPVQRMFSDCWSSFTAWETTAPLLTRLLSTWNPEQHDSLRLALTWLAKLGCIRWSHPQSAR